MIWEGKYIQGGITGIMAGALLVSIGGLLGILVCAWIVYSAFAWHAIGRSDERKASGQTLGKLKGHA